MAVDARSLRVRRLGIEFLAVSRRYTCCACFHDFGNWTKHCPFAVRLHGSICRTACSGRFLILLTLYEVLGVVDAHRSFYRKALPECNGRLRCRRRSSHRHAEQEGRGARPEPIGSIATAPPRAIKQNAGKWLLICLIAGLRRSMEVSAPGDVRLPLSHLGDV